MLYSEGAQTLEVVTLKDKTSLLDQCQPQWRLEDPDEAEKALLLYEYLRREKDGTQSIISCMVYLIMVDMSFS